MADIELQPGGANPPSELQKTNIRSILNCGQPGDDEFATNKATIVDGDKFAILDSEATDAPKHTLWSLIKSTLTSYFGTAAVENASTSSGANLIPLSDATGKIEVVFVRAINGIEFYNGTDFDSIIPQGTNASPLTYTLPTESGYLALTSQPDGSITSADISDASSGGNGSSDSGKAVLFGIGGGITLTASGFFPGAFSAANANNEWAFQGTSTHSGAVSFYGTTTVGTAFYAFSTDTSATLLRLQDQANGVLFQVDADKGVTIESETASNVRNGLNSIQTITSISDTLVSTDHIVLVDDDTASGAVTINLPAAAGIANVIYKIKKLGTTGNVTIAANGAETIDGSTILVLTTQYESVTIVCDGTEWHII